MNTHMTDFSQYDLNKIEKDLQAGWGVPTSWYYDPENYRFEMENIWNRSWLFLAPVHKLRNPGDTVVGWAGNVPVVAVCGQDRKIRGFVNLCRHRGYAVATELKNCNVLMCRYHAWTYNLDGTLRGAPNTKNEPGFKKEEMSLLPVSIDVWGPSIFVNADPDAVPFLEAHPKLQSYVQSVNFPTESAYFLENYSLVREINYDFKSNWKLWYDNNTECYHCPTIHSQSFGDAFNVDVDAMTFAEIDRFMTFAFNPKEPRKDGNKMRAQWQRAFQIFPAIGITAQDDILLLYQATPVGPEATQKVMFCLTRNGSDQKLANAWIDLWHQTFTEDQAATQIQQSGIRSGRLPHARYVTNQEGPVMFVNRLMLDAYRCGLATSKHG